MLIEKSLNQIIEWPTYEVVLWLNFKTTFPSFTRFGWKLKIIDHAFSVIISDILTQLSLKIKVKFTPSIVVIENVVLVIECNFVNQILWRM